MPVDLSIYGGALRPVKSVLDFQGEYDAADGRAQTLQQNRLAMLAAQQASADDQTLRAATAASGGDLNKLYTAASGAGLYKQAAAVQKQQSDQLKANADVKKTGVETSAKELEMSHKRVEMAGQAFGYVRNNPTPEAALSVMDDLRANGAMSPEAHARYTAEVKANPAGVKAIADKLYTAALSTKDQLTAYSTRNTGGTTDTLATNPVTGAVTVANSVRNTESPDAILSAQTSRANNAATVGASYANASATRAIAAATRDAASIQRDQATEMKLADDYRAQSKGFKEVADAQKQISATLDKATSSPAATLAAATKFMKLLDPGSVVRESELGMALAASGVLDRLTNYHNTLLHGRVLTPNQVKDFKDITGQIYGAAQASQKQIDANYKKQAETYKLRPEMIVQDLGQNAAPAAAAPSGKLKPVTTTNW